MAADRCRSQLTGVTGEEKLALGPPPAGPNGGGAKLGPIAPAPKDL